MSGTLLGALALELLALVHHLAGKDGIDARTLHTVLDQHDVAVQRVRSTLYNLAALGYVSRAAMSGHFRITADCRPAPQGMPRRPPPSLPPKLVKPVLSEGEGERPTLEGTIQRRHTPNSVFDVERL